MNFENLFAGSTAKPEDMYRIVEHFSLGRRRLELFGEDHNIRSGWLTVGKDLSSSNFNSEVQFFFFCCNSYKQYIYILHNHSTSKKKI